MLPDHGTLKLIHQSAVVLSLGGFFIRGAAALAGAGWVRNTPVRGLTQLVDTTLLAAAIALAWTLRLNPLHTPWLLAKIGGLLLYIALGTLAMRPGRPRAVRIAAWLAALATAGWIVSVAVSKSPWGFWAALV